MASCGRLVTALDLGTSKCNFDAAENVPQQTAPPEQKPTTTTNKKQQKPAKKRKKKSEPQFRTCLTQTCAILGSDFMLHFLDKFTYHVPLTVAI